MAGERHRLQVVERERLGSPETRRLRKQGMIPGVLYGKTSARAFAVEERALRAALRTSAGLHAVLDVVLEGQTTAHPSILKEYQRDPVRGFVRHIDLQEVPLDVAIHATVQVHLIGGEDSPGVREGGVLSAPSTTLNVEALPMEVPESIEADVSGMQMGDTLRLEDLTAPEGATFLDDLHETVIATVSAPLAEEEVVVEEVEGAEGDTPLGEAAADAAGEAGDADAGSGPDGEPGTAEG